MSKVRTSADRAVCRQGFTYVLEANEQLRRALKALEPERAVDMDDAAQRVSMEVPSAPT